MGREVLAHPIGNHEEPVRIESEEFLRAPHFVRTQGFAMHLRRIVPLRRPVADMAVNDDQCRGIVRGQKIVVGGGEFAKVVGI